VVSFISIGGTSLSTTAIVIIVIAVLLVVIVVGALVAQRASRRRQLRDRFGAEYDRTLEASADQKEAEADLRARAEQRDQLSIRPLGAAQRDRYEQDWRQVQAEFVDVPARSLSRADALVTDVMVDRGYPMQDFDRQADLISVDHPDVVENYRRAHGIYVANQSEQTSTEALRQGFVSYRLLFDELLGAGTTRTGRETPTDETSATSI
jgi:type II secretory pathway pseudopilin PulG